MKRPIHTIIDGPSRKLHLSLGRRRKFSSIGVHDLSTLRPPFRVVTVPITLICTTFDEKMSIDNILSEHTKGIEYAHLMEDLEVYPVILDSNDEILSFPPIINGEHTTVSESTTDFFDLWMLQAGTKGLSKPVYCQYVLP